MKITYLTHASLLIEINNLKIITDPWLIGPSWGGSLWHFPVHKYKPSNLPKPDIIYFSHGHDDHFHEETINKFPKNWFDAKILIPDFNKKWWNNAVQKFFKKKNIINLKHNETKIIKNLNLQMFLNDKGDFDSSLKISNNKNVIFLQTDNLMSIKEAKRISKIDKIDFAFMMPYLTGVFPGFYKWSTDDLIYLSKNKNINSLEYCSKLISALQPKYTIPYACDVGYLGNQFHMNLIHTHDKEQLSNFVKSKKIKTKVIVLESGDKIKNYKKIKIEKINNNESNINKLIKFSNENEDAYNEYINREKSLVKPKIEDLFLYFKKNLSDNLKKISKFNFKTKINIQENLKIKSLIINFKKNKIEKTVSKKIKSNLIINIEASKLRNLFLKKYPINFATLHNGGYKCERYNFEYSKNEQKQWEWMNSIYFKI